MQALRRGRRKKAGAMHLQGPGLPREREMLIYSASCWPRAAARASARTVARSTVLAVSRGARELNPLVRWFDGDPIAITALKLGTTAGTIVLAEKLWRGHNRTAAVLSMVAINSAYAFVVAHNYRTANRLSPR